jgi:hypothetical protein
MIMTGWQPVWCLARQSGAFTPIPDTTGGSAPFPSVKPQPEAAHRLAFRPPPTVVMFDVDHYDGKTGMLTMDKAEAWLGDLPPTWRVTSRGVDNPSGRYLFRKPAELDFTDSALHQFADDEGHTSVEIVRTSHRFSWAPGDVNHKNGLTVECYDPYDELCDLPDVSELPELPEAWVTYLSNPPIQQSFTAYTRPSDGPEWWLSQADNSLGSRAALCQFAFDMLASRQYPDDVLTQLHRVAREDRPGDPWTDVDFAGMIDANTQQKVGEIVQREQAEYEFMAAAAGGEDAAREKYEHALENFERREGLLEQAQLNQLQRQAIEAQYGFPVATDPMDRPQSVLPVQELDIQAELRKTPAYHKLFEVEAVRGVAKRDAAALNRPPFKGYVDIMSLGPVDDPSRFIIRGSDAPSTALIVPRTITVLAGHRASGKTWAAATWTADELIKGMTVTWIDYERQPTLLAEKFRILLPNAELGKQLRYAADMPPTLIQDVAYQNSPLVVIDSWRSLQNAIAPGTSANDGDAVEMVYLEVLTPLQKAGATIVILDHLPKGGTTTFGSERKESAADYVIRVEQVQAFSRAQSGYSSLTIMKDRYGHHAEGDAPGYLWVPGRDERTADEGIRKYPKTPEFRSWAPNGEGTLEGVVADVNEVPLLILQYVAEKPLEYTQRELAKAVYEYRPDLFTNVDDEAKAAEKLRKDTGTEPDPAEVRTAVLKTRNDRVRNKIRKLADTGKLHADATGRYEVVTRGSAPKLDPSVLEPQET